MQSTLSESDAVTWEQIAPLLDEAMGRLGELDRNAIVLRFFENKSTQEVAATLNLKEGAAHMRVSRALEKLRTYFLKRGVTLSAAFIASAVASNSVQAAPAGLANTLTAVAFVKGATASSATLTLVKGILKLMAWTKAKMAIVVGLGVALATVTTTTVVSSGQDRDARKLLDQVYRKYASLSSYSSAGKTVEEIPDGRTLSASFSVRFGRPNYYLVEYEQRASSFTNKGAVWADGSGDYFANDMDGPTGRTTRWPFAGPANNLNNVADSSGGATAVVPALFFDSLEKGGRIEKWVKRQVEGRREEWSEWVQPAKWANVRLVEEPNGKVGEFDCSVLSAEFNRGKAMLWIGKEDFLVHRSQQWVKSKPEDIDAELARILTNMQPPLPINEMKRRILDGRKKAEDTMKPVTVVFTTKPATKIGQPTLMSMTVEPPSVFVFTQTHENIVANQVFSPTNFTRQKAPVEPGQN